MTGAFHSLPSLVLGLPSSPHPLIFLLPLFDYTLQYLLCSLALSSSWSLLISLMGISINIGNWNPKGPGRINAYLLKLQRQATMYQSALLLLLQLLLPLPIFLTMICFDVEGMIHFLWNLFPLPVNTAAESFLLFLQFGRSWWALTSLLSLRIANMHPVLTTWQVWRLDY